MIRQPDLAVDEAKVRLNLAIAPKAWLMPAQMIINTQSTVGYNNKLKQAVSRIKLGVNNSVNPDTKKVGLTLMEGGPSKINPAVSQAKAESKKSDSKEIQKAQPTAQKMPAETAHKNNKIWLISGLVLAAFVLSHAVS